MSFFDFIGPTEFHPLDQAALLAVRQFAESRPFSLDELIASVESGVQLTEDERCRCVVGRGLRVAFTVEQHPAGWARHMSVSLAYPDRPGHLPCSSDMMAVGLALGLRMDPFDPRVHSYPEGLVGRPPRAMSVLEPFDPAEPMPVLPVVGPGPAVPDA